MVNCFNIIYIIHIKVIVNLNRINILLIYIIQNLQLKSTLRCMLKYRYCLKLKRLLALVLMWFFFGLYYKNNILILFRFKYSKSLTVNMNKQEKRTSEYYLTSKKKLISQ